MTPDNQTAVTPQPVINANNDTILAAVATLPIVGLIIYFAMPTASPLVRYYSKQGTGLFAAYVVSWFVTFILGYIPFIGGLLSLVIYLTLFVIWVMLVVGALQNKEVRVPVFSDMVDQVLK